MFYMCVVHNPQVITHSNNIILQHFTIVLLKGWLNGGKLEWSMIIYKYLSYDVNTYAHVLVSILSHFLFRVIWMVFPR